MRKALLNAINAKSLSRRLARRRAGISLGVLGGLLLSVVCGQVAVTVIATTVYAASMAAGGAVGYLISDFVSDRRRTKLLGSGVASAQLILIEDDYHRAVEEIRRLEIGSDEKERLITDEFKKYRARSEIAQGLLLPEESGGRGGVGGAPLALPSPQATVVSDR